MPIVAERKLFATGDSLAITFPKAWIRQHHLEPSDVVMLIANDDIVVRPAQNSNRQGQQKERNAQEFHRLRFSVLERDGFCCQYCGRSPKEDGVKLVVDHIIPISKGGTNEMSNLITACGDCNRGKSDRLLKNIDFGGNKIQT